MLETPPTCNEHEVFDFLTALYGQKAPGFLTLWRRQDRSTLWVPTCDVVRASAMAAASARAMDTYVGIALRRQAGGAHERGKLDDVIGIPSVWDDIDLQGPAHKKERLPTTREEALALLAALPLAPSVVVDSGWGIQPHWLFDRLWVFADASERLEAGALVRRFQAIIHDRTAAHGWTLDSTHDLTRVLRIPGTINHKLAPVRVRTLVMKPDLRYSRADFERLFPPRSTDAPAEIPVPPVPLPRSLPVVKLEELAISGATRELIQRGRAVDTDRYPSRSEAAWQALRDLLEAGCGDAEIAAIFLDPAYMVGEKAREQGRRWLAGEIARARNSVQETPRLVIHVSDRPDGPCPRPLRQTVSDLSQREPHVVVEVA